MAILDKAELVNYMITKHRNDYGDDISPIKLQKGLYFLFAFWGGQVIKQKNNKNLEIEMNFDENLFDADFVAWAYGPVDKNVYSKYKKMSDDEKKLINQNKLNCEKVIKDFVDNLLDRIFASNDFGLVDLSHEDEVWKKNHKYSDKMPSEDIINEYASR